jgi:DNA modification methylase
MKMKPYFERDGATAYHGDCREVLAALPEQSIHTCVTSPPYWGLRDYGLGENALGLEPTPELYIQHMVEVFREVRRVLRDDGILWLNLGDSYSTGSSGDRRIADPTSEHWSLTGMEARARQRTPVVGMKTKDMVGIPWRVALALQADGWWLRSDIIWAKPNPMPESVTDRPTKSHEYIFLLSKSQSYYYDADAIKESGSENSHGSPNVNPGHKSIALNQQQGGSLGRWTDHDKQNGRNKRTVWTVATQPFSGAHFAVFPEKLIEPCILAGASFDGAVLDPFAGSCTTGVVARKHGRRAILIDANSDYLDMGAQRMSQSVMALDG